MSAETLLLQSLQEWHRLAEAEGEAIRARNWPLVAECQKALRFLEHGVENLRQQANNEWAELGAQGLVKRESFRQSISRLIEIESRNAAQLTALRQAANAAISQLESASRTLRQVHRSYSPGSPAAWTSFS